MTGATGEATAVDTHATHNVATRLAEVAAAHPNQIAFTVAGERRATFGHYAHEVEATASGLRARGVGHGDRVVVFVPMSIDLYVLLGAIFRIGAVAVFIDPWIGANGIRHAATLTRASAFVGIPRAHLLRLRHRELRRARLNVAVGSSMVRFLPGTTSLTRLRALGEPCAIEPVDKNAHALITFTSGSTGAPKGADRDHRFLYAQTSVLEHHLALAPGDVHYTNLPIFALHNIAVGVTTAMAPPALSQHATPDGAVLLQGVQDTDPTVVTLSPAPLRALIDACVRTGVSLDRVRHVYTGGGPVLPRTIDGLEDAIPNATCTILYGSTECEPIAHLDAGELRASQTAIRERGGIPVGAVAPETSLRLIHPVDGPLPEPTPIHLDRLEVPSGDAGEVIVAGEHVNRGYYRDDAATRDHKLIDPDGTLWHRTGDVARRNEHGELWLLGRVGSDVEVAPGRLLYPLEVTTALEEDPAVGRVALVEHGGRTLLAVAGHPVAARTVRTWLDDRDLTSVSMVEVDEIPMDGRHAAKVDTAALRRLLDRN